MAKINGSLPNPKGVDQTQTQKYKSDEQQLKEDRSYFESLFSKAKNGDVSAIKELTSIRAQGTVEVNNGNDRLLNSNTAFLLQAQNEVSGLLKGDNKSDEKILTPEQNEQKKLIMGQLRQNPENDDITEADVQSYILQEQLN